MEIATELLSRKYIWFIDIDTRRKVFIRRKNKIVIDELNGNYTYIYGNTKLIMKPYNYDRTWGLINKKPNFINRRKRVLM